ncbi:MAG TPA: carbohydrate-binding family 9-like protein [Verrucomicrobiae bacterium]|nr:carbohydrate-binding family 9-like protein [Verrucomicrobiae bacterium]
MLNPRPLFPAHAAQYCLMVLCVTGSLSFLGPASIRAATNAASAFPCDPEKIPHYTAYRVSQPIRIDGKLDEPCWQTAPRSTRFVDILTGAPTLHDTRVSVLWDKNNLYVGFWLEEPNVQATFTKHNSPIYENNDAEVFIAGRDSYYEFEINALNTVYEAFFMWEDTYEKDGFAREPAFRRANPLVKPFNGVGYTNHPRGLRLGSWAWTFPGRKTAVHIDGTLNNDKDKDRGWTVELAFPWEGMKWLAKADGRALPPQPRDVWRIDFSRFNQYKAPPPAQDSGGWFWSPHGVWDSHIPECFPFIEFSTNDVMSTVSSGR